MYSTGGIIDSTAPECPSCCNKMKFDHCKTRWICRKRHKTKRCNRTISLLHNSTFFKGVLKINHVNNFVNFLIYYFDANTNIKTAAANSGIAENTAQRWAYHIRDSIGQLRKNQSFQLGLYSFLFCTCQIDIQKFNKYRIKWIHT